MKESESNHWIWNFIQLPQMDVHDCTRLLGEPI